MPRTRIGALFLGGLVLSASLSMTRALNAHEVPERVAVLGHVRVEGDQLRVLLRVPLEAMRDMEFPLLPDGSLDLVRVRSLLPDAARIWLAQHFVIEADGTPLVEPTIQGARLALPNDRGFADYDAALARFSLPELDNGTLIRWQQLLFDVRLDFALPHPEAQLVLRPDLARLGVRTRSVLHLVTGDGSERVVTYEGNPDRISLAPRWHDAARQFLREGFAHILGGLDHLLFVICLVLPVRRWRSLLALVTAFTAAHSLTLAAAVLGLAPSGGWFPPLVELAIAASIVWLTIENIVMSEERLARRWMMAFFFGLIHGFGFSFALGESLQFAGGHLFTALAAFNIGVEAGQLLVLAVMLPLLALLRSYVGVGRDRWMVIVGSAIVAHMAWHWMTDRYQVLSAYDVALAWPTLDAALALALMRFGLLLALALALGLSLRHILRNLLSP